MRHPLWHHLAMIVVSEVNNFIWLGTGFILSLGGIAVIFALAKEAFYFIAVGLPLALIGISVVLFKIHEIILVVVRPKRLEAMCRFCKS